MRYKLAIILLMVILSDKLTAQTIKYIDLKTGFCESYQAWFFKSTGQKLRKDPIFRHNIGFTIGFIETKFLGNKVYFGTEFFYKQKGVKDKIENTTFWLPEGDGTYTTYKTRLDYISFSPIFRWTHGYKFYTNFSAGPYIAYQIGFNSDFNYSDLAKNFNKYIFGLTWCGEFEYKIKKYGICLNYFQNVDLTNVMDTEPTMTSTGLKIKNNTYGLNLTIRYYFKTE